MIIEKNMESEIIELQIPPVLEEIIRQQGIILETYNLIAQRWSFPAMVYKSKEEE